MSLLIACSLVPATGSCSPLSSLVFWISYHQFWPELTAEVRGKKVNISLVLESKYVFLKL